MEAVDHIKELNNIKRLIERTEKGLVDLNASKRKIEVRISDAREALNTLKAQLDELKRDVPETVIISDHAIVRYLERVQSIDIESIRAQILTDTLIQEVQKRKGKCNCLINDGKHTVVVKNYVAVTVNKRQKKD